MPPTEPTITIKSTRGRDGQIRTSVEQHLEQMSADDRRLMLDQIIREVYQVAGRYGLTKL